MPFEDWIVEENAFDLALAADAFHWIEPRIGYPKIVEALRAGGSAALFWRLPVHQETELSKAIDQVYVDVAPQFVNPGKRFTAEWLIGIITDNFQSTGCFGKVTHKQYFWPVTRTTEQYIKGLRTFSMHKSIDDELRNRLYAEIQETIERFGGRVEETASVMLFHAFVKK